MNALFMVLCDSPEGKKSSSYNENGDAELFTTVLQANKRKTELEKERGIIAGWAYEIMQLIPIE